MNLTVQEKMEKRLKVKTGSSLNEVYDFLVGHKSPMAAHQHKIDRRWNELMRRSSTKTSSMLYEFEVDGTTCYHIVNGNNARMYYANVILAPFANGKYQYLYWLTECRDIFKYTSHFFERYKERMKVKGTMRQAVKQYFKRMHSMVCIYRNKAGQFVFAMEDGLVLGVYDEKLWMRVGCTFVDYSMLKPSQRAAFEKVRDIFPDAEKVYREMMDCGVSHKDATFSVADRFESVREVAEEIYSWYFEEGDLKERN